MQEHTRTQAVTSLPLNFAASQELECEFLLIEVRARRNALIEFSTFFCHRIITSSGFGEGCEKDRQRRGDPTLPRRWCRTTASLPAAAPWFGQNVTT